MINHRPRYPNRFDIESCFYANRLIRRLSVFLVFLIMTSCYTSKGVDYLQTDSANFSTLVRPSKYTVRPSDVLNIKVQSRDPDQAAFFNLSNENRNFQANAAALFVEGYSVDKEGMINLAIVGELKVSGLSVDEIQDMVQAEIDKYLLNAIVSVKLTSFKVSVLGDVKNPGLHYIYNAQATVFEALALAGDLNLSAKRKDVRLVRQIDDKAVVVDLDLNSPYIIQSPFYFVHPNDVIYVETSRPNLVRNNLSILTFALSAISTGLLILNLTN